MSRDRLRDPRGGAEGAARASHRHEDAPDVPVRVQAGREQVADRGEAAQQAVRVCARAEAGEAQAAARHREGVPEEEAQVRRGQAQGNQGAINCEEGTQSISLALRD